jgi:hypothetical protein
MVLFESILKPGAAAYRKIKEYTFAPGGNRS